MEEDHGNRDCPHIDKTHSPLLLSSPQVLKLVFLHFILPMTLTSLQAEKVVVIITVEFCRSPTNLAATIGGPGREHLGQTKTQPNQELVPVVLHVSHPFKSHLGSSSAPHHFLETQARTEKPKVTGGDRLEYQRTPENLILCTLATQGEPSPSVTAIVVNGGTTEARALCLYSVSTDQFYSKVEINIPLLDAIK
ncbi:hypothetical protein CR513_01066, partial [Mucuna pruriens]